VIIKLSQSQSLDVDKVELKGLGALIGQGQVDVWRLRP